MKDEKLIKLIEIINTILLIIVLGGILSILAAVKYEPSVTKYMIGDTVVYWID